MIRNDNDLLHLNIRGGDTIKFSLNFMDYGIIYSYSISHSYKNVHTYLKSQPNILPNQMS